MDMMEYVNKLEKDLDTVGDMLREIREEKKALKAENERIIGVMMQVQRKLAIGDETGAYGLIKKETALKQVK